MKFLVNAGVFALLMLITGNIAVCEPLRKIKGTVFPFVWFVMLFVILVITYFILKRCADRHRGELKEKIMQMTITHTEIPHLLNFEFSIVNTGYYLLRLYLQGIVKFACKSAQNIDGETVAYSCLEINEPRLETIKAQGGRHSTAAINMVRYIRDHIGCSISEVLGYKFTDNHDGHEILQEIMKDVNRSEQVSGIAVAAVLGFSWGLLMAKLQLGIANHKNVGFLVMMITFGLIGAIILWAFMMVKLHGEDNACIEGAIKTKHYERPNKINQDLINQVNTSIPTELERNCILNAYYTNPENMLIMAENSPEDTFMHMFAQEYDVVKKKMEEEARKAAEARENASSGCSSCSSCSSCGGCGGCGGCGD